MPEKVEVEVRAEDLAEATADLNASGVAFEGATSRGVDGAELASLVVTLGPAAIAGLTSFYVTRVRARRFVKLKYKGLVLEGVSEEAVGKILQQIVDASPAGGDHGRG